MESSNEKAKSVRLLILDIDGVMTTGAVYYCSNGTEFKGFHVHDGMGIKLLQKAGLEVAIITAKQSESVVKRAADLGIKHVYLGQEDKLGAYEDLKAKLSLSDQDIAYMGDDLPDLPILRRVNLAITVPNASLIIQQHVDLITKNKPGKGAVREACEFILEAQNKLQSVLQSYLTK